MTCPFCGAEVGNAITCPQCGATVATPSISVSLSLPLGTKLFGGKYSVGKVLGQGGFGITYMGADTILSRPVAIKELFPEGCQRNGTTVQPTRIPPSDFSSMKQRFLDEARLLASLNHPGIVKVYDFFEENNTAYMVMEFLRGKSLAKLVEERGGALSEQEAVGYILKVCEALDVVHKAGYLHRDIKPENIIVCGDGSGDGNPTLWADGCVPNFRTTKWTGHDPSPPYLTKDFPSPLSENFDMPFIPLPPKPSPLITSL